MAALDFPSSPTVGQLYPTPVVAGIPQYKWDGSTWVVNTVGSTGLGVPVGGTTNQALVKNSATDGDARWDDAALPGIALPAGGFSALSFNNGTKSSGTFTPDPLNGNIQHYTNGGAHTLAPPADPCTILLEVINSSAGAIATSGFTLVTGDNYSSTGTKKHLFQITKTNAASHLHIIYMPTSPVAPQMRTRQIFLSGSGTYTTPAGCTQIDVEMRAGGGGGAGASTGQGNGSTGGATTFGSSFLTCNGGAGGAVATNVGANGGTATGGDLNLTGTPGGGGTGTVGVVYQGGNGGGGGAGHSPQVGPAPGGAAAPNTGGGGGGGATGGSTGTGSGGGEGGYLRKLIAAPSATYAYAIGAGGAGGASSAGGNGGTGGSGIIIVTEYYN